MSGSAAAQQPSDSAHPSLRFNTGQNPTVALSQFQPFLEWNALPDGVERWEATLDGVYAFSRHLQVIGELPFVTQSAGTAPGASSATGLGDLYVQPT